MPDAVQVLKEEYEKAQARLESVNEYARVILLDSDGRIEYEIDQTALALVRSEISVIVNIACLMGVDLRSGSVLELESIEDAAQRLGQGRDTLDIVYTID